MGLTLLDTLTDGTQVAQVTGTVNTKEVPAASTTLVVVASATTSTALLASNPDRKGFTLYNDGGKIAYVALSASSSTTAFSIKMPAGSFYDFTSMKYTGPLSAVWNGTGNTMQVTEIV
jgi:hypothetical protein